MFQFFESIRFEKQSFHLLDLHQERMNSTFAVFYPGRKPHMLVDLLPSIGKEGKYKLRFNYNAVKFDLEYHLYQPKRISSLKIMEIDDLDYGFKFSDRSNLEKFLGLSEADEIIIVKNGYLTDSSYSNIALFDGKNWLTPTYPLLAGVRRAKLLSEGILRESKIEQSDLKNFQKVSLINAMLDLGEMEVSMEEILK